MGRIEEILAEDFEDTKNIKNTKNAKSTKNKKAKKNRKTKGFLRKLLNFLIIFLVILLAFDIALVFFIPAENIVPGSLTKITDDKLNILLMGTDESGLRTDSMMVAVMDVKTGAAGLISVPRDIKVTYPQGRTNKLNAVYGISNKKPTETVRFIEEFTGLKINYYAVIKPQGFRDLIDSVGGVKFDVPIDMKYDDPAQDLHIDLKAGMQILDGDKAEQLTRFRGYPNADLGRIEVQRNFIKAVLEQKVNIVNILRTGEIFARFQKSLDTNIAASDIPVLLKLLQTSNKKSLFSIEVSVSSQSIGGASYLICDPAKTKALISKELQSQ